MTPYLFFSFLDIFTSKKKSATQVKFSFSLLSCHAKIIYINKREKTKWQKIITFRIISFR